MTPPGHNRPLPNAPVLARAILAFWRKQLPDIHRQARWYGRVSLTHWNDDLADALFPHLLQYAVRGYTEQIGWFELEPGWIREKSLRSFLETVARAARTAAVTLAMALNVTNAGIASEIAARVIDRAPRPQQQQDQLRQELQTALRDRKRAAQIARDEASRALHLGQVEAVRATDPTLYLRWWANATACDVCLPLHGKTVRAGEPFLVRPGPFGVVTAPPVHPRCRCTVYPVSGP